MVRLVLRFPTLVRWFVLSAPRRRETGANLVSTATVYSMLPNGGVVFQAHALQDRAAAEYGILVFVVKTIMARKASRS